jgi:hypothetical protein
MNGDRLIRFADLNRNAVVFHQQSNLLGEVGPEKAWPRHAGLVHARPRDEAVGETRIEPRVS